MEPLVHGLSDNERFDKWMMNYYMGPLGSEAMPECSRLLSAIFPLPFLPTDLPQDWIHDALSNYPDLRTELTKGWEKGSFNSV
jgi:hypothetical protein